MLINVTLLVSSIDVGSHNPPPFRASFLAGILFGVWLCYHYNSLIPPLIDIVRFGPLRVAVSLAGTQFGVHPPIGPTVLQYPPPSRLSILTGTLLSVRPL